ncbi:family 20 glycosylhydrolase [Fodinicola feengrottensis]|uniref:family 20 glycosylhydrolase n=1 Tax=Fodinicola feengrottensis TaxID=435914 RepID=UPI0013D0B2D8|nr:family 20 glycosylhydrolase [Fodinicola feengrottensis]
MSTSVRAMVAALLAATARCWPRRCTAAPPPRCPLSYQPLRQWTAGTGNDYQWATSSRLVVDSTALAGTAATFDTDLATLTGRAVQQVSGPASSAQPGDIVLSLSATATPTQSESYALTTGATLTVAARTDTGVFNGTRTILQLLRQQTQLPAGTATDWPASPERGFSVDVARKIYTVPWLQREIQDMAYLKLNLLHLHLSDNEAFRVESSTVPGIVSSEHYTKQQISDLVTLAGRYHITVVPEFDMPSHLAALLNDPDYQNLAIVPAANGAIDIANPAARDLLASIVREYLPLFPGKYWDLGADEYVQNYAAYPSLVNYAHSHWGPNAPAIDTFYDFVNSMATLVQGSGKTLRMWNDQLTTDPHPEVPLAAGIAIDYWNGTVAVRTCSARISWWPTEIR